MTLSLQQALEIALQNNLAIQIQKIQVPLSQEAIIEREGRFDPVLYGEAINRRNEEQTSWALSGADIYKQNEQSAKAGVRKLFGLGTEADTYLYTSRSRNNSILEGLEPQYRTEVILSLRQPLLQDFGTDVNTTDISVAKNDVTRARQGANFQVIATLTNVERTYHDLSGALTTLALRQEYLQLGEKTLSENRRLFDAGLVHVGEVQQAESAVASRQEYLIAAGQIVRDLTNVLKNTMQLPPSSPLYAVPLHTEGLRSQLAEPVPTHDQAFRIALDNRPDYAQRKVELQSNDLLIRQAKNQLLPRLDLVGTAGSSGLSGDAQPVSFTGDPTDVLFSRFDGDYGDSWDYLSDTKGYQWSIGLTIEFPLGNNTDKARYNQAQLLKDESIMNLRNLEDQINLEIKLALENIASSRDRIRVADQLVALAQTSLNQEEARKLQGLSDTFRILIFQGALVDAQIRAMQAKVDYNKALAELYRATGTTLQQHHMRFELPEDRKSQ